MIPHILLWKSQTATPEIIEFLLMSLKQFIVVLSNYFIEFQAIKSMPSTSNYYTQALTFINRVIVINREFFLNECFTILQQ